MWMRLLWLGIAGTTLTASVTTDTNAAKTPALLIVANQVEHTLLVVDPKSRQEIGKVVVGVNGHEVAVSRDGKLAYVPIYSNVGVGQAGTDGRTIDVIDIEAHKLVKTIDMGKPVRPHRALFGPDGMLYVSAELAKAIDVVDPGSGKVVGEIPTGQEQSHMFVLSPDGSRIYTSNVGEGSVSVLDVKNRKLITVIPVTKHVQRISITPDGSRVFTQDTDTPRVAVIDTATNKVSGWIVLPESPYSSAVTPDGKSLLVITTGKDAHRVHVVDVASLKIVRSFDMPAIPSAIMIRPDGERAYVSSITGGNIAVIDLKSWKMEETITLTHGVDGMAWVGPIE
jgi:YVTN family beta-propeller protein